jgi:hypothetical protein
MLSPIEGEVSDVNEAVLRDASLLVSDPYGDGWLLTVISPEAETNFRNLLSGDVARQWMEEAENRLRSNMRAVPGVMARDRGDVITDSSLSAAAQSWNPLTCEFFSTGKVLARPWTREEKPRFVA